MCNFYITQIRVMAINVKAELVEKQVIKDDIIKFGVKSKEIADSAKPGNFLEIRVSENIEPLLRRPISIYNIDKENGIVEFIFQIKGKGTKILSEKRIGEEIDIIGPLGYGVFDIKKYNKVAIIGGGIGIFPLHELAKQLHSEIKTYLGFRNKNYVMLEDEFEKVSSQVIITTDDGSYGNKGFAIEFLKLDCKKEKPDIIFACGPLPMLKAIKQFSEQEAIPCQISLEEKMGCGIGACLGCAVEMKTDGKIKYGHICKQGPVFYANEVEI